MRERGVLIGTTGRDVSTLKIRPPLVIRDPEARQVVATLDEVLADLPDVTGVRGRRP
jgi:4-aminobutyrate aminotransferase-like enzyme